MSEYPDEPNPTAIAETPSTAAEVGAEAASSYLNARAMSFQNQSLLYIQEKPRQAVFFAILVGVIIGRLANR